MTDSIHFPPASKHSKLSACPTTKVPQGTDWIYQDCFNQMLHDNSIQHVYPTGTTFSEGLNAVARKSSFEWDGHIDYSFCATHDEESSLPDLDNSDEEDPIGTSSEFSEMFDVAPVLIESSCTTSTEYPLSFRENSDTIITQALKKRKSTSSFRSLKSFISVFSTSKKLKLDASPTRLFQFFKRR
ncbi:hypothetical protein INT47_001636 [Mucor saturninus]|uniref:Uncharacterized protein n=1 Tax=Mucor saturninus TaxID=64648 RepID=A0A8H7RL91_9FUNG|nr:hypothetical protein INT47_001636 [Mucor saturninus]